MRNLVNIFKKPIYIYTYIICIVFLFYGKSIKNNYALDDNYVTVTTPLNPNNQRVEKGLNGITKIFTSHYIENEKQNADYRPIALTSFAIEYNFFGSNPHISHLISLLLYCLTLIILYKVLIKLLSNYSFYLPILIITLFATHPIHSEVVLNIKCRDELFSFLFGITALLFSIKYYESKKTHFLLFCALFILVSILSKLTGMIFIFFIPFTMYFFKENSLKKLFPIIITAIVSYVFFVLIRTYFLKDLPEFREFVFFENPLYFDTSISVKIQIALATVLSYLKLFLLPISLSCYYGYNTIETQNILLSLFSFIIHILIFLYAIKTFKKRTLLSYSILIYLLGLFPVSNILDYAPGIIAERFAYFASLGFCFIFSILLCKVLKLDSNTVQQKNKNAFLLSTILILVVYFIIINNRIPSWKNEETILNCDAKNNPKSCNLHYMLGNMYYSSFYQNKSENEKHILNEKAKYHYTQAIKLMEYGMDVYPSDYNNKNNLATIYVNVFNDPVKAKPLFNNIVNKKPENIDYRYNYAFCLGKLNLLDSAINNYKVVLKLKPNHLEAYFRLNEIYLKYNKTDDAIVNSNSMLVYYPNDFRLYIDLGNSYMIKLDTINALKKFNIALELQPQNQNLKNSIERLQ